MSSKVAGVQIVKTHKFWKWIITVLYVLALFPLVIMSIFMLMGGFIFAFDAPIQSSGDEAMRWLGIILVVLMPVPIIFALILIWKKTLWWFLLGLPSFLWAAFGVALILAGPIIYSFLGHLEHEKLLKATATQFVCQNKNLLELDSNNNVWEHSFSEKDLGHQTTRLGTVDSSIQTFAWNNFGYAQNDLTTELVSRYQDELQTCKNADAKSIFELYKEIPSTDFYQ